MARPRLTFACELDAARLTALVANGSVLDDVRALDGRVALMPSDFSEARAAVVRQLNAAAIPVIAIPLMPYEDGYYFTVENAPRTRARYDEWKAWTTRHSLAWEGVGLDIEPEARVFEQIMANTWRLVPMLVRCLGRTEQAARARTLYSGLFDQMRSDGYRVEKYQFRIAYSLVYPAINAAQHGAFVRIPAFGVPCPTAIFTAGLLMLATPRVWALAIVPIVWAAIGGSAASLLGVRADYALPVAGVALLLSLIVPKRHPRLAPRQG